MRCAETSAQSSLFDIDPAETELARDIETRARDELHRLDPTIPRLPEVTLDLHVVITAGPDGLEITQPETSRGTHVPTEVFERLARDARWRRILYDPVNGDVVEISKAYKPPPRMADRVRETRRHLPIPQLQPDPADSPTCTT